MRSTLLRGRIRTSTALIALVFVCALVTYLLVRPDPAGGADEPTVPAPTTSGPVTSAGPSGTPSATSSPGPATPPPSPTPSAAPSQSGRTSPAPSPSD